MKTANYQLIHFPGICYDRTNCPHPTPEVPSSLGRLTSHMPVVQFRQHWLNQAAFVERTRLAPIIRTTVFVNMLAIANQLKAAIGRPCEQMAEEFCSKYLFIYVSWKMITGGYPKFSKAPIPLASPSRPVLHHPQLSLSCNPIQVLLGP